MRRGCWGWLAGRLNCPWRRSCSGCCRILGSAPRTARSTAFSSGTKSPSKKTLHAAEQERPAVAEARQRWKANQTLLDTTRLVFVDETGTSTKMVRTHGRCRRGQRLIGQAPWGHWTTTTFTAGLRCDGLGATRGLGGPVDGG